MAAFASTSSHGCLGTGACAANVLRATRRALTVAGHEHQCYAEALLDDRRIEFAAIREHARVSRNGAGGAQGDFE